MITFSKGHSGCHIENWIGGRRGSQEAGQEAAADVQARDGAGWEQAGGTMRSRWTDQRGTVGAGLMGPVVKLPAERSKKEEPGTTLVSA